MVCVWSILSRRLSEGDPGQLAAGGLSAGPRPGSMIHKFMNCGGATVPVGTLWARTRGARQTASFEYHRSWLGRRDACGLDPVLPAGLGRFHTDRPLFNAFTDSAPDRWGQTHIRRNELRRASAEGRQPKTLLDVDFLTLVDDGTRLGVLGSRRRRAFDSSPPPAGVRVAPFQLRQVSGSPEFTARRFDRRQGRRIPFMSALTAIEGSDNEMRSYLEVAGFLRRSAARCAGVEVGGNRP